MRIIGLTGSIGMGKSATAAMLAKLGVPVHAADAAVHRLYAGAAVAAVEAAFPGVAPEGYIDRARLAARVIGDADALARLEAIVHPLVRAAEADFIARRRGEGHAAALLDIPLLFETGAERRVDAVVVVTAPEPTQRARVLARPGMTEAKLAALIARQTPDKEKRRRAHFVVDTGGGFASAERQVAGMLRALAGGS